MSTYRDFVAALSPTWGDGYWGQRLLGTLWGITADTIAIALSSAIVAPWFHRGGKQPSDALPLLGAERNMPRYPVESHQEYRDRLWGAWDAWEFAGNETAIESQYEAAGYTGAEVYEPKRTHSGTGNTHGDWQREPVGYWSQFWVFFPKGTHGFGLPPTIGTAGLIIGGGGVIGASGTYAEVQLVRGIANKWRPAHVICRELVFEITGETIGTGHLIGEAGLTIGATGVILQGS